MTHNLYEISYSGHASTREPVMVVADNMTEAIEKANKRHIEKYGHKQPLINKVRLIIIDITI